MADPRKFVALDGIGQNFETFAHDDTIVYDADEEGGSAQVGLAVTIESAKTVTLIGDGEKLLGRLTKVEGDGYCTVQIKGNMQLPGGSGATLTEGTPVMGDLGTASAEGYIQTCGSGVNGAGMILDSDTATAVWVQL